MSRWTHNACFACYCKKYPKRTPSRLKPEADHAVGQSLPMEDCCYCGQETAEGIYVRDDPDKVACRGRGGAHEE